MKGRVYDDLSKRKRKNCNRHIRNTLNFCFFINFSYINDNQYIKENKYGIR